MKIPPANPLPARPSPEANRGAAATTRRGPAQSARAADSSEPADAPEGNAATAERDFASVLEEVSRPDERQEDAGEGDRRDARSTERAEHETEARRREDREGADSSGGNDSKGGGFEQRAGLREMTTTVGEATGARAILHIADLERIVSAVRTQAAAGGGREVTIELRRSVLEGLRVRLSADGSGRVTAEFVAASERVRSQLDARASELAELLRGRGVNLAALRTSVEAGGGSAGERDPRGRGGDVSPTARDARVASPAEPSDAPAGTADESADGDGANTYRA